VSTKPAAGQLFSSSCDDKGQTSRFRCELADQVWKIDGNGIRFRGAFDTDWNRLTGIWETESDGSWSPWMHMMLTRAD
jgi:hypothetical protein